MACTSTRLQSRPLDAAALKALNDALAGRDVEVRYYTRSDAEEPDTDESPKVHLSVMGADVETGATHKQIPLELLVSLNYLSPRSPRLRGAAQGALYGGALMLPAGF